MAEKIEVAPEYQEIYNLLKDDLHRMWRIATREFGINIDNYSSDHPIRILEEDVTKNDLIRRCACFAEPEKNPLFIQCVLAYQEDVINELYRQRAKKLNKSVNDLTDEEREEEMYRAFDYFILEAIFWALYDEEAEEIIKIIKEYPALEDFKETVYTNYDKIDFERKWYHTRAKSGTLLSLNELTAVGVEIESDSAEMFSDGDADRMLEAFVKSLDAQNDRDLVKYLLTGYSQEQIAKRLGLASQSAVSKRIKKLREKFEEFKEKYI